jgi:methylated-DNA-[protein]-cysteine S-methyltransferase
MMEFHNVIESPFGELTTHVDQQGAVVAVYFGRVAPTDTQLDAVKTRNVDLQLWEYFSGQRKDFDLPLDARGTEFQKRVWEMLIRIPFGATRSYGELARELGQPGSSRAVGRANATNPIAIIVPCHRVIGSNGTLTGYAGGLSMKEKLLQFEQGSTPSLF